MVNTLKRYQQKSLLRQGSELTEAEASALESALNDRPDDLAVRFQLIGFHGKNLENASSAPVPLYQHLHWLLEYAPDQPLFSSVSAMYLALDRDQLFTLYKVLLDVLERFKHSPELLVNALGVLRLCRHDPELEERLSVELAALRAATGSQNEP